MTHQRIVISGSSGLIGTALIRGLLSERPQDLASRADSSILQSRPELFALTRSQSEKSPDRHLSTIDSKNVPPIPESIDWHPELGVTNPSLLENMWAFVHLAGRPIDAARWTESEKSRLRKSRVLATQKLVDQIKILDAKPSVFLGASAVGYYGDCGSELVTEARPASQDFLGNLAADWEEAAQPLESLGVRLVHVRLGVVLAASGGALGKVLTIFRIGLGGSLGSGNQFMAWIGLEDCIRAIMFLLQNEQARGPFNLVSPQPITNREFTKTLGKVVRRPTLFWVPGLVLKTVLGEMGQSLLLTSCKATSEKLHRMGFQFQFPDLYSCLQNELSKCQE